MKAKYRADFGRCSTESLATSVAGISISSTAVSITGIRVYIYMHTHTFTYACTKRYIRDAPLVLTHMSMYGGQVQVGGGVSSTSCEVASVHAPHGSRNGVGATSSHASHGLAHRAQAQAGGGERQDHQQQLRAVHLMLQQRNQTLIQQFEAKLGEEQHLLAQVSAVAHICLSCPSLCLAGGGVAYCTTYHPPTTYLPYSCTPV